ncbi:MAG: DUF6042 family protein [Stackebrandtia sp.]
MSYDDDAELTLLMDWERSGWSRFLPFEGRVLWDVFCDATTFDIDGDLDTLVDWHLCTKYPPMGLDIARLLDAPLHQRRFRIDQRRVERTFARAGYAYPRTARDIVDVGVQLGLFRYSRHGDVTRWRVPLALPLPTEVLPMTTRQRLREDARRWHAASAPPASRVAALLLRDGQAPETVTSISQLARCLDADPESVRQGLVYLCGRGFERRWRRPAMRVFGGGEKGRLTTISPERLDGDDPCLLVPHWRTLRRQQGTLWQWDSAPRESA